MVLPRALWCMERLVASLYRALHEPHAAHAHSPFALTTGLSQGALRIVYSMHTRSLYSVMHYRKDVVHSGLDPTSPWRGLNRYLRVFDS